MGSLSASGIPVVGKNNHTFRKRDVLITLAESSNDTVSTLVDNPVVRTITSGSVVRKDGLTATVEYLEDLVYGVTRMGRTCLERIASNESCTRQAIVDLAGNQTQAVIETSLQPNAPQEWTYHQGETVVRKDSVTDAVNDRVPGSGVFDEGFPL